MKIIFNITDTNAAGELAAWARDAYIAACHQWSANQWTAEAAGYPDGRIECYDIKYGNSTSEDIYNGRALSILVVRGETYDNIETKCSYDDDPQAYQEEIDGYIRDGARELYDNDSDEISNAINAYREWISDRK